MKKLFSVVVFLFGALFLSAQSQELDKRFNLTFSVGGGTTILDNSIGFHIEAVPGYKLTSYFDLIGQFSYTYIDIKNRFLIGGPGYDQNTNILFGGRLSFLPEEEPIRIYANLLIGAVHGVEEKAGITESELRSDWTYGTSIGLYIKHTSNVCAGLALESLGVFVFKVGYQF